MTGIDQAALRQALDEARLKTLRQENDELRAKLADPSRHETPDVAELRRLAEAATPGPWWHEWVDGDDWWAVYGQPTGDMVCPEVCTMWGSDESAYIAAANPAVVLGLLDATDALRRRLVAVEMRVDDALRHGYDLDPQEIASALAGALDALDALDGGQR